MTKETGGKMNRQPLWQYEQISAEIMREINTGKLKIGQKLPSEKELCDLFDVSRITVRKALADLEERNYIENIKGREVLLRIDLIQDKI